MKKLINEIIKVNQDNDELAISKLSQKPLKIVSIKTRRTGLEEWNKIIAYEVYSDISYEQLVAKLVAEKYNQAEESAIQRKAIMNGITDEFLIYNAYVEGCKAKAKAFIEERNKSLGV